VGEYLKNIYQKLSVNTHRQEVEKAKNLEVSFRLLALTRKNVS
jgi:ATP/maltotriose-dependent transcriptional regulator MalT